MMSVKEIRFQYYEGNVHRPFPIGLISVEQFVEKHRNPNLEMATVFNKIDRAVSRGDLEMKNKLKQNHLYYFTPSAIFEGSRKYVNIRGFTGLAQLDFDGTDQAVELKAYLWEHYDSLVCAYLSPSRRGVKCLIKLPIVKTIEEFKEYYAGMNDEFSMFDSFDPAPKNVALPLFLSHDHNILYREDPTVWDRKGEVLKIEDYTNLIPQSRPILVDTGYKSLDYYKKISCDIFETKIDSVHDSDGHPTMRDACLVLGSRVGAGYLHMSEAESYAVWKVSSNQYFHKDLANYLRTVRWALNQGATNPKYYS